MKKKIVVAVLSCLIIFNISAFAMTTQQFDRGMAKGIEYFNKGMYAEAVDEFTWFRDYNYEKMNPGQQKYLDEYLYDAKWYEEEEKSKNKNNTKRYINVNDMSIDEFCDYTEDLIERIDLTMKHIQLLSERTKRMIGYDYIMNN